jgi:DNA helicase-2/ATP-dependent DNA helicase PcrA
MLPGVPVNADPQQLQDLLEGLNEPQREAVTHGEGPLLILAGAGSGKTRVLTHRIAYLIFTGNARASEILAITFTNKAAGEMRERVQRLLGADVRGMWLMTFHAACARMLRANAELLGYDPRFTIYDQADTRRLLKRCIEEAGVDSRRYPPAVMHSRISAAKNSLLDPQACVEEGSSEFQRMMAEVYRRYQRDLREMNAMDFDDLLFQAVWLLEREQEVRERYASTFRHVLVDEYQDTNHAQYRLLQLLAGPGDTRFARVPEPASGGRQRPARGEPTRLAHHRNLAVVGDDSQSIYGFRGADIRNILDFQKDFQDARVVKLEQNYRSTNAILEAANALIAHNRAGIAKRLWSELGRGSPIRVSGCQDEHAEARFVVGEIERLVDEGASRDEIAVLYRTNAISRVIEDALVRTKTPYQVIGGAKFYERAEIKDAVAYLTWLSNPYDVVAFQRIANSPRRGLGATSLSRIVAHSATVGQSVWDVAAQPQEIPGLGAAAIKALSRFMSTMEDLAGMASAGATAGELIEATLTRTGYTDALELEAQGRGEKALESQGRVENLQELIEVAHEFQAARQASGARLTPSSELDAEDSRGGLDAFLEDIALKSDADTRRDEEGMVTLMTLHNAKGLEYPIVFIAGCEHEVIPHMRALKDGSIEEERRLLYVGVTRAMRELYLTYAVSRTVFGERETAHPSPFIEELPADLLDREEPFSSWHAAASAPTTAGERAGLARPWHAPGEHAGRRRTQRDARRDGQGAPVGGQAARYRLGQDVVHPAFGEGVVTGIEPNDVIVVRFARDRSERKILLDLAPISPR